MPNKCKIPDCTKETIYTVFQMPQNKKTREQWVRAVTDAYPNLVLGKTLNICEKHFKKSDVVAFRDITESTGKIFQRVKLKCKHLKRGAVPYFTTKTDEIIEATIESIKPELDEIKLEIIEQEMEANADPLEMKVKTEPSDYACNGESYAAQYIDGYDSYSVDEIKVEGFD